MDTLDVIHLRCNLKTHISGREIELETINAFLEAGRLATSACNNHAHACV